MGEPVRSRPRVLLAGGGSGGHVFPALAVGEAVRRRGGHVEFVGSPDRMEARIVPERGVPFHGLRARPVVGRGLAGRASALLTLVGSSWRARRLVKDLDADVVLATGGYVSAAPVLGARLAGRPVVLLEPNADPGLANRVLSRLARAACVAYPETARSLRCPSWITGVPVRELFLAVPAELPPHPPLQLLLLGGSQGSEDLNRLLPFALEDAAPRLAELRVVHQAGHAHVDATRERYRGRSLGSVSVEVVPFLDDPAAALARSHLVVSRAGAITLAELCAAGRGAILVPLSLAGAHQLANAEVLQRAGAAEVLHDAHDRIPDLSRLLGELLSDPGRLREMARAARRLARPEAAESIARHLAEVAS